MDENQELKPEQTQTIPAVEEKVISVENQSVPEDAPQEVETVGAVNTFANLMFGLSTLVHQAHELIHDYKIKHAALHEKNQAVMADKRAIAEVKQTLNAREDACRKVEDVVQLQKDAQALMDSASLRLQNATAAENKLKADTDRIMGEIREERAVAQRESQNIANQRKALDEEVNKRVAAIMSNVTKPVEQGAGDATAT